MPDPVTSKMKLLLERKIHVAVQVVGVDSADKGERVWWRTNGFVDVPGERVVVEMRRGRIRVRPSEIATGNDQFSRRSATLNDAEITERAIRALRGPEELLTRLVDAGPAETRNDLPVGNAVAEVR
jgi:hypothetical protein